MFRILIFIACFTCSYVAKGQSVASMPAYEVYFFLLEDCKITQAYTQKIQAIYQQYACDSIRFTGFFPNPVSEDASIATFVQKHQLPFTCTREEAYRQARRFGVVVTPEVVVYNTRLDSVMYQGRIDNLFERVGQRRQVVTSHELEAALYCIQNEKPILVRKTEAVGCFLN